LDEWAGEFAVCHTSIIANHRTIEV
jgi:hypothetical protein